MQSDKLFHNANILRSSENKTRIIKMTSLDGEYMLLGRRTEDVSNIFVQYGQGATRTVNVTRGPGIQEAEFVDGLRFSIESDQDFTMNVDLKNGIPLDVVPDNAMSLSKIYLPHQTHHCTRLSKIRFVFMGSKYEYGYSSIEKRRTPGSV